MDRPIWQKLQFKRNEMVYIIRQSKIHIILKFFVKIISIFLIITITIALYDMYRNIDVNSSEAIEKVEETKNDTDKETEVYEILENVSKAVVGISKLQSIDSSFFSLKAVQNYNLGTGVIIAKEGYAITNNHVTGNLYSKCYITMEDGEEYTGNVIWTDEDLDLSIIKINTTKQVDYAMLGDSDSIKIGQKVFAIGNPLGIEFQRTVTSGIISACDRTIKIEEDEKIDYMEELIQTDASINNGNSGGPLIDIYGNILGITTVKIREAEGIGFAVPINIIKPIIQRLVENKTFEEASLGIYGYDKEAVQYIDSSLDIKKGIYVSDLVIGGAARSAGIQIGDIIEKIDDIELEKINELRKYIYTKKVGDEVKLTIIREKKEHELVIKLKKK